MVKRERYRGSSWITKFVCTASLKKHAQDAARAMRTISAPYDTIVFSGSSGTLIGPILALRLEKEMVLVRKEDDENHSGNNVEGFDGTKKYIIVDDFVDSGATVKRIQRKMHVFAPKAKCLGVVSVQELDDEMFDTEVYSTEWNLTERATEVCIRSTRSPKPTSFAVWEFLIRCWQTRS
jgi:adenine/guanine phosphoribosyltransferase-like PRPP-binding protein